MPGKLVFILILIFTAAISILIPTVNAAIEQTAELQKRIQTSRTYSSEQVNQQTVRAQEWFGQEETLQQLEKLWADETGYLK